MLLLLQARTALLGLSTQLLSASAGTSSSKVWSDVGAEVVEEFTSLLQTKAEGIAESDMQMVAHLSGINAEQLTAAIASNTEQLLSRPGISVTISSSGQEQPYSKDSKLVTRSSEVTRSKKTRMPPCQCRKSDESWTIPTRTSPKCIFIDLGAANGDTFRTFLSDGYGPVKNCNHGDWEAILVEANPGFAGALDAEAKLHSGKVHTFASTAAYMCEGNTSFWIDPDVTHNHWGSTMDFQEHTAEDWSHMNDLAEKNAKPMQREAVTVPTTNINRLIHEYTIPGDYVIMKMDIEGAEWDILPCLAKSSSVWLLDALYVEMHPMRWQMGNTTAQELRHLKELFRARGIVCPETYFTQT